jgi:hypothetical protein
MKSTSRTFTTVPADHGNCGVGQVTHGMKTLAEVAGWADVAALLECSWVTWRCPLIPTVSSKPAAVTYGPLAETRSIPT